MNLKALIAAPLAALLVMANAADLEAIKGWGTGVSGLSSQAYAIGIDTGELYQGKRVLTVKSTQTGRVFDYGTVTQALPRFGYAGKRLRLSAVIKAENLDAWAGVWMVPLDPGAPEFFGKVMPHGTGYVPAASGARADWQPVSVVIDLPIDMPYFQFGVALIGHGQVWATDLKFEEVGQDVPLTTTRVGLDVEKREEWRRVHTARIQGASTTHPTKVAPVNLELQ